MSSDRLTIPDLARVLGRSRQAVHQAIERMLRDPGLDVLPWPPDVDPETLRYVWPVAVIDAWRAARRARAEAARAALRKGTRA